MTGKLIGARRPPHGALDRAGRQLAPVFDRAHIGFLRIALEEVAGFAARGLARQGEGFAQKAVIAPAAPAGHPACEIARAERHVENSETGNDRHNIGTRKALVPRQFEVLPVLVFGLAGAAAFGASVLRTAPQGSLEALASGIFFSDSR